MSVYTVCQACHHLRNCHVNLPPPPPGGFVSLSGARIVCDGCAVKE